jgi:hypothetical protein
MFYKVLGNEPVQTFQCLAYPPSTFYSKPSLFSLGEWVSIGHPGTYWGNVGLVHSLSEKEDENEECLTILLVPWTVNNEDMASTWRAMLALHYGKMIIQHQHLKMGKKPGFFWERQNHEE